MNESNIESKDKNTAKIISYAYLVIPGIKIRQDVGMKSSFDHQYKNNSVRPNLCSSYDNIYMWSHRNPSDMRDAMTMKVQTLSWTSNKIRSG